MLHQTKGPAMSFPLATDAPAPSSAYAEKLCLPGVTWI